MARFTLLARHERVLEALPVETPTSLDELRESTGLQLIELLDALLGLTNNGYLLQETRPNARGGVDRMYVQLATRNASTETVERDPEVDEIRPLTTYVRR